MSSSSKFPNPQLLPQFRGGPRGGTRDRSFDGSYGPREPGPPGVSGPSPAASLPGPAPNTNAPTRPKLASSRLQVTEVGHLQFGFWFFFRITNSVITI